mmetsp:Transcript_13560/g.44290  ORF Transcript_13560/g.44290 Transcript_13560/m.44290 type:complete len:222 (+) Transcript_13560:1014-1679(+)
MPPFTLPPFTPPLFTPPSGPCPPPPPPPPRSSPALATTFLSRPRGGRHRPPPLPRPFRPLPPRHPPPPLASPLPPPWSTSAASRLPAPGGVTRLYLWRSRFLSCAHGSTSRCVCRRGCWRHAASFWPSATPPSPQTCGTPPPWPPPASTRPPPPPPSTPASAFSAASKSSAGLSPAESETRTSAPRCTCARERMTHTPRQLHMRRAQPRMRASHTHPMAFT